MKKLISMLVCLVLLAMIPMQALAATGDVIVIRTDDNALSNGVNAYCGAGDALYILLYGGDNSGEKTIAVHHVGDAEMKTYSVQIGEPVDEDSSYADYRMLSDGEKVYVLRQVTAYRTEDNDSGIQRMRAELYEIALDGDVAIASLVCEPDWSLFATEDGYYNYVDSMICVGDYILASYYDDYGNTKGASMKLSDGVFESISIDGEIISMTAYIDGKALIQQYANDENNLMRISAYDPATGEIETLCEAPVEEYDRFRGMACDSDGGVVYYVSNGEIFELNLQTGESSEALTEMPLELYSDAVASVLDGGYYAAATYDSYCIRSLNPDQKPTKKLKIYDCSYDDGVKNTSYAFANEHSDTSVVVTRDYSVSESLVEDMMNRSSDVDVYVVSASSSDYEAVFSRGYLAELSGSEKLQAVAERMYPTVREALSVNGQLCALPIEFTFWLPFVYDSALEKLGMTFEDLPTNWSDFLDFLIELPEKLPVDGSVTLMDSWTSDVYAKQSLFEQIFASYQQQLKVDPNAFSTEQMTELLQKLEQVDFHALGQPTEEEVTSDDYMGQDSSYLLELNMGMNVNSITRENPMVMSMNADTPAMLAVSATVAFVNPFSENMEAAMEYMEALTDNLSDSVKYVLYSDLTEPVENTYYEESLKNITEYMEELREQYETAEEVDKQDLEEQLKSVEETLANYEQYRYTISEDDIAWIHNYADALVFKANEWLYSDGNGDAYQLVQQYCQGQIDAKKLMDEIGRKIQMMLMEGY